MGLERILFLGEPVERWNNYRRAMEQAGGLDLMLKLRSELAAEGYRYAVIRENRIATDWWANTLTLRWDLEKRPGRWWSRGIKLVAADDREEIDVLHTGELRDWGLLKDSRISLETKARHAITLAVPYPDRFHSNPFVNALEKVVDVFEARKVA